MYRGNESLLQSRLSPLSWCEWSTHATPLGPLDSAVILFLQQSWGDKDTSTFLNPHCQASLNSLQVQHVWRLVLFRTSVWFLQVQRLCSNLVAS